ncbi:MAG: DNA polymerase/3'-5' exonuclease PolX [Spirochaetales bacterium]|nr:DNA polymerase/3'-5' exonuclease PolX [Spirochaetales bacterium]
MDNREIADKLAEIAVLKQLAGENTFKIRAFENAGRMLENLPETVSDLAAEGRLTKLRGIGEALADTITELIATGTCTEEQNLKKQIPEGLIAMLSLQGMGPKKIRSVWQEKEITTIEQLEAAAQNHLLQDLAGFGAKTEEKILKAIQFHKESEGLFLSFQALFIAEQIKKQLEASHLFSRIEIAGSLRRGKEIVKDADILLVSKAGSTIDTIQDMLVTFADKDKNGNPVITGSGKTKTSLRFLGLQIDFRVIEEKSFACAFQYFTGSKEHNTMIRGIAKEQGKKVNEYEILDSSGPLYPKSEEEFYQYLGLSSIPPELREAGEEIEHAKSGAFPRLVTDQDIKGLIHCHTTASDGELTLLQLAELCIKNGLSYMCVSDHSQSAPYAGGLSVDRLLLQIDEIEMLNRKLAPFHIFKGIESDIHPDGTLDYPAGILAKLDFVIGAVHSKFTMTKDEATKRLITAISNPFTTILAHPSGRLLLRRDGYSYDEDAVIRAAVQYGVVIEHNANPHRMDIPWQMMKKAIKAGVLTSINPDLHESSGLDHIRLGITMARKAWCEPRHILNCKTKEEIDEYFRQRKKKAGYSGN